MNTNIKSRRVYAKKALSILLAVVMMLGSFSIISFAAGNQPEKLDYVCTKETHTESSGESATYTYSYDKKGNLLKETCERKSPDLTYSYTYSYTYDGNGNLSKQTFRRSDGYSEAYVYTFNSKGNMTKRIYECSDGTFETEVFTYNGKGYLAKEENKSSDGRSYKRTYTYDSNGNLTKIKYNSSDAAESYVITYEYDSKGNRIKETYEDSGNYSYTATYTYDSRGNMTKEAIEDSGEYSYSYAYIYDFRNNLIMEKYKNAGNYEYTYTYLYDLRGDLTKEIYVDTDGQLTTRIYDYDRNGNCSKITENESDGDSCIYTYEYKKAVKAICETNDYRFTYDDVAAYTGKPVCPSVTVSLAYLSTAPFFKGVDYTVSYKNNTEVGEASMTLSFSDGTRVTLPFRIKGRVTGLKATPKKNSVKLNWTKYPGAKYYKVEQTTNGKTWKTVCAATRNNYYTVRNLTAGKKYKYRVTALDSNKKEFSLVSTAVKTCTLTVSPAVTLKSAKAKTATVTWKKVTGASKYIVYKSADGRSWTKVKTTTKLTYTLKKLTGGKKIYVKVYAVNAYGQKSAASAVRSVTVKK